MGGGPPLGTGGPLEFGGGGARPPVDGGPLLDGGGAGGPLLEGGGAGAPLFADGPLVKGGAGAGAPLPGGEGRGLVLLAMFCGKPPLSLACFRLVLRPLIVASLLGYVLGLGTNISG